MAVMDPRRGASQAEEYEYRRLKWTDEEKKAKDALLSPAEKRAIPFIWEFFARPNQLLPPDNINWQTWLIMAGRGFGKTRTGGETVRWWIKKGFNYVNIIAPTADDARDVCIEGESGILQICPSTERPEYVASKRQLRWQNGATSLIFTADEPERLRGKQHMKLWCDELAAWRYLDEAWTQAMLGLRLGLNPQAVVTTTPRPLKPVKEMIASPLTFLTRGTTYENKRNLAEAFYSRIITKYEGTRLGRQELQAEVLEDRPGALFHLSDIDKGRVDLERFDGEIRHTLARVVVSVDPAASANKDSDETGIVVCGMDKRTPPHFYVFDDRSAIYSPEQWGSCAVHAYQRHKADRIIAEKNNGGDMVLATIRHVNPNVALKAVHASKGKVTRAEPVAALYEQGRVHHVGTLSILEDQMCDYEPGITEDSPDRMDALVWGMTELSEGDNTLGLVEYLKGGQAQVDLNELQRVTTLARIQQGTAPGKTPADMGATNQCPQCSGGNLYLVGGGQKRCNDCGNQWWPGGKEPRVYRGEGRGAYVAVGGRR